MQNLQTNQPFSSHPARGFAQSFGLAPSIALFTLCVDAMLFGAEAITLGLSLPLSLLASGVVGFVTFKGQILWYGDDADSARTKALMLAFLTFVPTALPSTLYLSAGLIGMFHKRS